MGNFGINSQYALGHYLRVSIARLWTFRHRRVAWQLFLTVYCDWIVPEHLLSARSIRSYDNFLLKLWLSCEFTHDWPLGCVGELMEPYTQSIRCMRWRALRLDSKFLDCVWRPIVTEYLLRKNTRILACYSQRITSLQRCSFAF